MAHRDWLRARRKELGTVADFPSSLGFEYHAYDYAFRAVVLSDKNSPLDLNGEWRDPDLIEAAERWHRELFIAQPQRERVARQAASAYHHQRQQAYAASFAWRDQHPIGRVERHQRLVDDPVKAALRELGVSATERP